MTRTRPTLAGLTVLVPRARDQASELSALLRSRGAEPLEVPAIEIRPVASTGELDRAVEDLAAGRFDWVVLTSVNGVAALRDRAEAAGRGPGALGPARVAAVGPATEVALRAERSFLQRLGGSCTLPAGAMLRVTNAGPLEIQGFLSALDGKGLVRERLRGPADDPEGLGRTLAGRLLDACGPEVRALVEGARS